MKKRLQKFWKKLVEAMKKPEMRMLPGQLAFFFLLSLIPLILVLVIATSFLPNTLDNVLGLIAYSFPAGTGNFIQSIIDPGKLDANFFVFLLIALYMASNGAHSIVIASDSIYKMRRTNYVKARIKAGFIIIYILLLLIFFLLVPVFANRILKLFGDNTLINTFSWIYQILKWPISFMFILFGVKVIYTIAPNERIKSSTVNYGSIFTTICWIVGTKFFSYYIINFTNYDIFYGSISNVVILMIWIYMLSYVFMLGMAMNAADYYNQQSNYN